MKKTLKILGISVLTILVILGGFLVFWFFGDSYNDFYKKSQKEFAIAGLNDGFIPQGLCYTSNTFLTSGYMKDGSASRIYVVDKATNDTVKYFTLKIDGEFYVGHAGGIATNGTKVWVAGDKIVHTFNYSDLLTVENAGSIDVLATFEAKNGADFLTVNNNLLWIGEFHKTGKYDTAADHTIQTASGKTNKAISFAYEIDNSLSNGFNTTAVKAISTGSQVQGMAISNDSIILSSSYSLPNSKIYCYNNVLNETSSQTFDYSGEIIPLYVLVQPEHTLTAPSMSEEIEIVDGRIYILFENACAKYKLFTREKLTDVYSFTF